MYNASREDGKLQARILALSLIKVSWGRDPNIFYSKLDVSSCEFS